MAKEVLKLEINNELRDEMKYRAHICPANVREMFLSLRPGMKIRRPKLRKVRIKDEWYNAFNCNNAVFVENRWCYVATVSEDKVLIWLPLSDFVLLTESSSIFLKKSPIFSTVDETYKIGKEQKSLGFDRLSNGQEKEYWQIKIRQRSFRIKRNKLVAEKDCIKLKGFWEGLCISKEKLYNKPAMWLVRNDVYDLSRPVYWEVRFGHGEETLI